MTTHYDLIYVPLGAAAFGGAERSLLDLAGGAVAKGRRVIVFAEPALRGTPFPELAAQRGIALAWTDWAPERPFAHSLRVAFVAFRRYRAPVVHFNISWRPRNWIVPIVARLFTSARLLGSMRAMPDPHGSIPRRTYFGVIRGLQLWRIRASLIGRVWARALHVTVSINRDDYPDRLVLHYGYSRRKLRVIYNGVHLPAAPFTPKERRTNRRASGFADDDFVVCCAGRVARDKGIHHLIEAMAAMPADCKLAIVGDGPQRKELEIDVERRGLCERVHFLGFRADPYPVLGAADVVAIPSTWHEAFGRVVVEAMGYAVPVVASRIGGMAELFTSGCEGIFVPAGDVAALRDALLQLYSDPAGRVAMGERARRLALERYSFERVNQEYGMIYDELAGAART